MESKPVSPPTELQLTARDPTQIEEQLEESLQAQIRLAAAYNEVSLYSIVRGLY